MHSGMSTFTNLPAELQALIWGFSWEPRTVIAELTSEPNIIFRSRLPASLHVHQASRDITCRSYCHKVATPRNIDHPGSTNANHEGLLYLKADLDVLFIHGPNCRRGLTPEYLTQLLSIVPVQHLHFCKFLDLPAEVHLQETIWPSDPIFFGFLRVAIDSHTVGTVTFLRESLHSGRKPLVRLVRYTGKHANPPVLAVVRPPEGQPDVWQTHYQSIYPWRFLPDPESRLREDGAIIFANPRLDVSIWRVILVVPDSSQMPREMIWFLAIFHRWVGRFSSARAQEQALPAQSLESDELLEKLPYIIDGVCVKNYAGASGGKDAADEDDNCGVALQDLCHLMEIQVGKSWPQAIFPRHRAYRDAIREGISLDMEAPKAVPIPLDPSDPSQAGLIRWSKLLQGLRDRLRSQD